MSKHSLSTRVLWLLAIVPIALFLAACSDCTGCKLPAPTVTATIPICGAAGVATNSTVTATFSEAMDPATINATTFTVAGPGTTPVPGAVTYNASTMVATFTPTSSLAFNTLFTITISSAAKSALGVNSAGSSGCTFTTAPNPIPPAVSSLSPSCNATGVATNRKIAVTFSEAMDPTTLVSPNFTVTGPGVTPIGGTITYVAAGNILTFAPTAALPTNTFITVTVTTGAKSAGGTALPVTFSCGFTTGLAPDTTAPTVLLTIPSCGATGVALNTKVAVTFSEAMDPSTITGTTFTVTGPGVTPVPGSVAYAGIGNVATFTPTSALAASTLFTINVSTGAKDLAGNPLANAFSCTFTTGAAADTTPPTVILNSPTCGATAVPLNKTVNITFSEAMDPLSITPLTILLAGPGTTAVSGTVSYDPASDIATLTPTANLASNTLFTVTATTGVKDLAGNHLVADITCTFTTAATLGPAGVDLGTAANFVVLAGSTVTNTGPSLVNGDLGLSPGTAVTGFPPGVVNGTQHINDAIAAQAKLDLTTAYNDAAGRSLNVVIVASGELGGLTLAPGLYRSGISSFAITSVDLTLDAQGDSNAVFIFQMPSSTLTVGNGRKVILAGGAKASNIFWQVGSAATIGTTAVMEGTIMADQAVTLGTGAVLNGRAFARIAAVSMDSNTVTIPAP